MSDGKNGFSEAEGITVLSLFDGMSCGQIALQKLGTRVKQYYAAEIDKHAIQVTIYILLILQSTHCTSVKRKHIQIQVVS